MRFARARSLACLGVLVAFGVLAVQTSATLHNTDTYFHLRFGHEFLTGHWSLRHPGSVSTFATADWVPTQWLPEVVMAQFEEWFGLPGVAWLSGLQQVTLAATVYWACRRQSEPVVATALVVMTLVACSSGLSMRPQVISYVLTTVTAAVWLRARETGRPPWPLVPVTWLWAVCHGMWPLGVLIGLVAVVGLALDRARPGGVLGRMLAVPVLSGVAALLTPVGPSLFPAVLQVTSRAEYFYEWGAPDLTDGPHLVLLLMVAVALVALARRGPVAWFDLTLVGLALSWAVYSQRTGPTAACLAAPLAAAAVQPWLGCRPETRRVERAVVLGGYALTLAALAVVVPRTADQPLERPQWLDATMSRLPEGTVVLGDQAYGGFLMWRYPQVDLVTHGYGDTFTDAELERNADILGVRGGWLTEVRSTGADYAVLPPGMPLAYNLRVVEHWRVLHGDAELQLLAPPPGWYDEGS